MNPSNPMNPTNPINPTILLTFDVEDWFQVENFKQCFSFSSWPGCELRVEKNVHRILDLLDSVKLNNPTNSSCPMNHKNSPKATFFVLGWLAERLPHLVREIQARGHEVASHGFCHELCREQSRMDLKNDLEKSKKLLEDITGTPIYGYRAPSFSVDHEILRIIEDSGYFYDSSFNSFRLNRRYGQVELGANNGSNNGISIQISDTFFELPISNLKIGKYVLPWGGGGYFRLIPLSLFRQGVEKILKRHGTYLFYLHPWEVDSDQPKVAEIKFSYKFRHYINLNKTLNKLSYFLEELRDCRFQTCHEYLTEKISALDDLLPQ
jgi:polysaccharide deacetylase family protein (PEP-CTERM system associated)